MASYRQIAFGIERVAAADVPRHIHREGYANIVLGGTFTEASFAGRTRASPGTVLLHGAFDCHSNVSCSGRPTILRVPWRGRVEGAFEIADPDDLAKLCEKDPREAELALSEMQKQLARREQSWPDELATALRQDRVLVLRDWAEERSISPASLSRGFRDAYGVSPQRFRLDWRTRLAWRKVVGEAASLTEIAHECSFADLSHMSRNVSRLTGASPMAWRSLPGRAIPNEGELPQGPLHHADRRADRCTLRTGTRS